MLETGVSNHHLLIFPFLKTSFTKMPPNKLLYRKYKSFDKIGILKDVSNLPEKTNYTEWENQFLRVLKKHAPLKSNVIRGNNFQKAILRRSALKKKANNLNHPLTIKLCKNKEIM